MWRTAHLQSLSEGVSLSRLKTLWDEERRSKGGEASLCWAVWLFCRTRLLLSILCLSVTQLAGFSGPVRPVLGPVLSTSTDHEFDLLSVSCRPLW